jgi:hypothetical protein
LINADPAWAIITARKSNEEDGMRAGLFYRPEQHRRLAWQRVSQGRMCSALKPLAFDVCPNTSYRSRTAVRGIRCGLANEPLCRIKLIEQSDRWCAMRVYDISEVSRRLSRLRREGVQCRQRLEFR